MNTENDSGSGALYSTFDALNHGVYKFTPSSHTRYYQQAPYSKSSYYNGVFTAEDLNRFVGDPVLQLLLPFGLATPNRVGFQARLSGHWAEALHATLEFASLEELEGLPVDSLVAEPAAFQKIGVGAKLDLDKLLSALSPLEISGSWVRCESDREKTASELGSPQVTSDLRMAGFTWRFLRKWGLLGGYQDREAFEAARGGRVHFVGHIGPEQLGALYRRAELAVCPSLYEGFGLTLLEAMAAGCPVLAADIPAHREVAGDAARLVAPRDERAFADGLRELARDGGARADLRGRGLERSRAFNPTETRRRLRALLQ
jgi:hypothetical protein